MGAWRLCRHQLGLVLLCLLDSRQGHVGHIGGILQSLKGIQCCCIILCLLCLLLHLGHLFRLFHLFHLLDLFGYSLGRSLLCTRQCLELCQHVRLVLSRQLSTQCLGYLVLVGYGLCVVLHQPLHVLYGHLLVQGLQHVLALLEPCKHLLLHGCKLHRVDQLIQVCILGLGLGQKALLVAFLFEKQQRLVLVARRQRLPCQLLLALNVALQLHPVFVQLVALVLQVQRGALLVCHLLLGRRLLACRRPRRGLFLLLSKYPSHAAIVAACTLISVPVCLAAAKLLPSPPTVSNLPLSPSRKLSRFAWI
eukprot:comp22962_c0_seq1/m.36458 comp22962_c0_seq1/g.36458  ORF comp22962_c0_seq1/g.36458 comp22962_c0_seq1/m.36458 type:complete len:307 (+) comp22962_c0_seq1:395-1315(+)